VFAKMNIITKVMPSMYSTRNCPAGWPMAQSQDEWIAPKND